ncbi:MAG: four helix bundle protein [Candidatus Omnitrophica bacterium]|nr:four helix bundle protein [Candidatus Omnitrophota bacterium]
MQTFTELLVWKKSHEVVLTIYPLTRRFPREECDGLVQQMRRTAIAVAANIAGGHQRRSKHECLRLLEIAHTSLDQLTYYVILGQDLGYVRDTIAKPIGEAIEEVGRMLDGLESHVRREVQHE